MGENISTREAYGRALVEFGGDEKIYVFDADLKKCTMSMYFAEKYPERFFNIGIAEANMVDIGAGFAACGATALVHTFAIFASGRVYDQVRNDVAYPGLNVKVIGSHAGLTVGEDGATHQCNEDMALMRTIPGMTVVCPSDDVEAKAAVKAAYEHEGPVYLRFGRLAVPVINNNPDYKFELGKGVLLREGTDVTLIATGLCVNSALEAAEMLTKDGVSARVVNIHTIKPLDVELVVESAKATGKVVTVEEHSIVGGLGGAVCEALAENAPTPVLRIGVKDVFGESGPATALLAKYKLDGAGVYEQVKEWL